MSASGPRSDRLRRALRDNLRKRKDQGHTGPTSRPEGLAQETRDDDQP